MTTDCLSLHELPPNSTYLHDLQPDLVIKVAPVYSLLSGYLLFTNDRESLS